DLRDPPALVRRGSEGAVQPDAAGRRRQAPRPARRRRHQDVRGHRDHRGPHREPAGPDVDEVDRARRRPVDRHLQVDPARRGHGRGRVPGAPRVRRRTDRRQGRQAGHHPRQVARTPARPPPRAVRGRPPKRRPHDMTINHRAEAEKHLDTAARHLTEHPGDMRIAEVAAALGQGYAALAATQDPVREQLATLLERWEEVADSYKPTENSKHPDLEERYRNYRYVQLRAIRNLRQVLDMGTMPCELATDEEKRRGDCGQVHPAEEFTERDTWVPSNPEGGTTVRRAQALKADQSAWLMLGRAIRRE